MTIGQYIAIEDMLSDLSVPEVSITGAVTLTATAFGKLHVCSGTTADYTVTLPAAAGNAGKMIGFRMAAGMTKFVTIDGNGAETISGAANLVCWANETVTLYCDGTNWVRLHGTRRSLCFAALSNATTTVPTATVTKIPLNELISQSVSGLVNTGSSRIDFFRAGEYLLFAKFYNNSASAIATGQMRFHKNGTLFSICFPLESYLAGGFLGVTRATFAAGDYLELFAYHGSGADRTILGAAGDDATSLYGFEIIQ